jgi:hypothetical protein
VDGGAQWAFPRAPLFFKLLRADGRGLDMQERDVPGKRRPLPPDLKAAILKLGAALAQEDARRDHDEATGKTTRSARPAVCWKG